MGYRERCLSLCCYSIRHINTSPRPPPPIVLSWSIRPGASTVTPTLSLPLPFPSQYIYHSYHTLLSPVQCCSGSHTFNYPLATMKERRKEGRKTLLLLFHFWFCLLLFLYIFLKFPLAVWSNRLSEHVRFVFFPNFDFNDAKRWNLTLHGTKTLIVSY